MAKRKPLVSQHLENISREALEKYQEEIIRLYVRRRQGSVCALSAWENTLRRAGKQSPFASRPSSER